MRRKRRPRNPERLLAELDRQDLLAYTLRAYMAWEDSVDERAKLLVQYSVANRLIRKIEKELGLDE